MDTFIFWQVAFGAGWVDAETLRQAVKTTENPFGEITATEYQEITGEDFNKEVNHG